MPEGRDQIYLHEQAHSAFVFDDKVAAVFGDMIERSVPGYATIVSMTGALAERFAQPHSRLYDLGSSLGATTLAMRHQVRQPGCRIVAVDKSEPMVRRCRQILEGDSATLPVDLVCGDLFEQEIVDASVVV